MEIKVLFAAMDELNYIADQEANEGFSVRASKIRNGAVLLKEAALMIESLESSLRRAHDKGAADARSRDFAARYGHEMGQ